MNDSDNKEDVLNLTTDMESAEATPGSVLELSEAQVIHHEPSIEEKPLPSRAIPMARISVVPIIPISDSLRRSMERAEQHDSAVASADALQNDTFELAEDHVVEEGDHIPLPTDTPVEHAFDFGTPGMVFDDVPSEENAGRFGGDDDMEVEISEVPPAPAPYDSESMATEVSVEFVAPPAEPGEMRIPPLPTGVVVTTGPQPVLTAPVPADAEEELDIQEIEEVRKGPPVPPPSTLAADSASSRPIDSFFRDDKVAAANAALKLEARLQKGKPKGKREWWATIFDDEYLMLLPPRSPFETQKQIDFLQKTMGLPQGSLLLDLACGNGPNAIGLAQRGFRVVGVDLSLSMLARAGDAAQDAGVKINFIHGDMRDLGFDRTFDGVMCTDTSFGFFDEQTNMKVLNGIYRALKPGGVFLLEVANRDFVIRQQPNMVWFQMDNMVCMEETDFNYINNRLYISRQLIIGDNERQTKHEFSLRLFSLSDIGQLLHHTGFAVLKVSGHRATPGAFFGPESAKLIIVAERRGD